jgi:hypothetical protein
MEELEPIPGDLRTLLEEEKAIGEPPDDVRERVLLRLAGTFAVRVPGVPSPDARPVGPTIPRSPVARVIRTARLAAAARTVRAAAIFVTGAATGAGGYHVMKRARHPAPPSTPIAAPGPVSEKRSAPEAPKPAGPDALEPSPVPPGTQIRRRAPAPAAPQGPFGSSDQPDDPLAVERSLLEMARAALSRGQAERALTALRRHVRQFPNGELTEEREGLLVQALVSAQKYDQARVKADQFKKHYPRSLFAPVVDQAIGSIP